LGWQPLTLKQINSFLGLTDVVSWNEGSVSGVEAAVQAPSAGTIFGFSAAPILQNFCAVASFPAGSSSVTLSAHVIDGLIVPPGVIISSAQGLIPSGAANAAGWTKIEVVGIPVAAPLWTGIGKLTEPEGLIGALTDPLTAAVQRLQRGAPPVGWASTIAAGVSAPPWSPPGAAALVNEVNTALLDLLNPIVRNFAPNLQAGQTITVALPPPANSLGQRMSGPGTQTTVSPLVMGFMAAATDPFMSLVLGFGTAYASPDAPLDFMVTAHWEQGLDGKSAPFDQAALIPAPGMAGAPPPPANAFAQNVAVLRPLATDQDWRATTRVAWDRPLPTPLSGAVSFAAGRARITPAQPTVALMASRPSGGFRPIAINAAADPPDPDFSHLNVMDREIDIPSSPGTSQLKYGVAVQDIYGQWTPWTAIDQSLTQPGLDQVRIVSATLSPVAPSNGSACPTTLDIEFLWEWRIRTPWQITFVARMYAAASHGAPPPSLTVPVGFDRALMGGGAALAITFNGDTPSALGAVIRPLTEGGDDFVAAFGSTQGDVTRRYRLTLSGLTLDFAATPFIGLAIWAQGQERIAPQRVSAWSNSPTIISVGDPRPPVIPIQHVTLGSLPDATGASHAQIGWTAQPNAIGYFVYEATEAGLLDAFNLPQPAPAATLDQRLQVLRNAFRANPLRRPFTRVNATAFIGTSMDIALPRGSTGIHCYVVIGVSSGLVESAWPGPPPPDNSLIAIAAPRIAAPATPTIEVDQFLDQGTMPPTYKASLLVTTRPGHPPKRVDIHRVRVDEAARELDTMGPPIARLRASGGGWTVTSPQNETYIATVSGTDAPGGSWQRVWYRAVAWTDEDDTRGLLAGRSAPSNAAWVVLPPADPPALSALLIGGQSTDVTIQWTCASPVARTPLGPHQIAVRAAVVGAPAGTSPLIALDATLDQLGSSEPAIGSGVWITGTVAGVTTYRAIVRRAAITDVVRFLVKITDPIGRTSEQFFTILAGPVHPAPDLENLLVQRTLVPPPGRSTLRFTSNSPLGAFLDGSYTVKITALPRVPHLLPPPPSLTVALGEVPTRTPGPLLPALFIVRSGTGPAFTYNVSAAGDVGSFVVRITAPDGQFVEKTAS
jgi:hypothetical protein